MIREDRRMLRPSVDFTLVRRIVKARNWWQRLQQERGPTISIIAEQEGVGHSYVTRILRLAFLSPRIVDAIINCRQPGWMDDGALSVPGAIAPGFATEPTLDCLAERIQMVLPELAPENCGPISAFD
jgi:hypothetical protein